MKSEELRGFVRGWAKLGLVCLAFCAAVVGFAAESINITATPRYPWNGLVDLKFTIDGTSGTKYDTSFTAKDVAGGTNLTMKTLSKSDGTAANVAKEQLLPGTYNWVWDTTADLGEGTVLEKVVVEGKTVESNPLYMVVDLSEGSSAKSYPVSYLGIAPTEGWSDEYKTTKIVLKCIEAGSFYMGSPVTDVSHQSNETYHEVTLLKPYYIAVFPLTQYQYYLITGSGSQTLDSVTLNWGSVRGWDLSSASSGKLKLSNLPGETGSPKKLDFTVTQSTSASDYGWPDNSGVDPTSLIGKIRSATGLQFDLPTEAQWELACKDVPGEGEWCLDVYVEDLGATAVIDPVGPSLSANSKKSVVASAVKIWQLSFESNWSKIECVYNGTTYSQDYYYTWYDTPVYLTFNAYGCQRVVKGLTKRSAGRTYDFSVNPNVAVYTSGVTCRRVLSGSYYNKSTYKVTKPNNPSYAIRLCVLAK